MTPVAPKRRATYQDVLQAPENMVAEVIAVGTATLGALIGAGGFGQATLTGVRLDRTSLILEGAIPAAVLALLVQALFELVERLVIPRGLRT